MKRRGLCLLLALCLLPVSALANSWGAPGGTVTMFTATHAYDDYISEADDYSRTGDTVRFVMHSRYHNQLICGQKIGGEWTITMASTKAVWQPDDDRDEGKWPELERTDDGFTLLYENESYRFGGEDMILKEADCNGLTFTYKDNAYLVEDPGGSVRWPVYGGIKLADFNVRLMPRTLEDVLAVSRLSAIVSGGHFADAADETDRSKQAVYSAPGDKSWRAADGKASVSLKDPEGLYYLNHNDGWDMIQYQVSMRTSRVGYIECGHLGNHDGWETQRWNALPVITTAATYLTDDPEVSQYRQGAIPAGTAMTMLGRWDDYYAYVDAFVDGKPARGFVPLQDLAVHEDVAEIAALDLPGSYEIWAGGSLLPGDGITFAADGSLITESGRTGSWSICKYNPAQKLFWNEPALALHLTYDGGAQRTFGLTMYLDGFSVTNEEGSGGYIRTN